MGCGASGHVAASSSAVADSTQSATKSSNDQPQQVVYGSSYNEWVTDVNDGLTIPADGRLIAVRAAETTTLLGSPEVLVYIDIEKARSIGVSIKLEASKKCAFEGLNWASTELPPSVFSKVEHVLVLYAQHRDLILRW